MRRIRVVGNSGSGKTHLAKQIAAALDLPRLELDALQHRPGWQSAPVEEFRAEIAQFLDASERSSGGWVVEGNYLSPTEGLFDAADTYVWLDHPRWLVMGRVVRRTLGRLVARRELWNGNRERWRSIVNPDHRENIILWAWTQHQSYRETYGTMARSATDAEWIRLRGAEEVKRWVATLRPLSCRRCGAVLHRWRRAAGELRGGADGPGSCNRRQ